MFVISSKSLVRLSRTRYSENVDRKKLRRIQDLDGFLFGLLQQVRDSGVEHACNMVKEEDELKGEYLSRLSDDLKASVDNALYYRQEEDGIPFVPFVDVEIEFDMEGESIMVPANVRESQDKLVELIRNGDT